MQALLQMQFKTGQRVIIGKVTLPDTGCECFSLFFSLFLLKYIPVSWTTFRNCSYRDTEHSSFQCSNCQFSECENIA